MSRSLTQLATACLLVVSLIAGTIRSTPVANATEMTPPFYRTDGHHLAWFSYPANSDSNQPTTIFVSSVPLSSPVTEPIATITLAGQATALDISGDILVWAEVGPGDEPSRLGGRNLATGAAIDLPQPPGEQFSPTLTGSRLVWANHDPAAEQMPWKILTTDLSTSEPATVVAIQPGFVKGIMLAASGDRIAWAPLWGEYASSGGNWDLWTTQIGGSTVKVASGATTGSALWGFDLGGSTLVYSDTLGIHAVVVTDPASNHIISKDIDGPTTDGRYVFWENLAYSERDRTDVTGYDLATDSLFGVAVNTGGRNASPIEVRDGVIVWFFIQAGAPTGTFRARTIEEALPSARQPKPGKTSPDWSYYPRTGHYLSFGFRTFWNLNGGRPVFGYPMTEEFTENDYTVQYFERQRFEWHPELAGTPYEVELGLLGVEDAIQRGIYTTSPFQSSPASTRSAATCIFTPQTGHRVCFGFKSYWQSHGLDMGDPGVSFRESLALFGYPISEEFTDPVTGLTTQYFERAVFEYHPDNPDPYKIMLRRLGAGELQARGWMP